MRRFVPIIALLAILSLIASLPGCEKEKVVESTEYVRDIEYVELPADTVYRTDTVVSHDSVTVENTDTVIVSDTVVQTDYVYDTVLVHDTVEVVENHYDTVVVTDTVMTVQCDPTEQFAVAAMQYYCDPIVIDAVNQSYGLTDGWIFYLSCFQLDLTKQSSDVYDIYGYIDYWTPDWSGFAAFEFYWRVTYTGGDPADVNNWELGTPPTTAANYQPGIKLMRDRAPSQTVLR
ncbi:MAG: hypothetical protein JSW34_05120 [Candidatus Zixiibacteriota bacterium]|nr:MAG: hypothetical protein JSW34_05120 [candidate division Zixibacteria bacterium]